jgi:hypothetical protein
MEPKTPESNKSVQWNIHIPSYAEPGERSFRTIEPTEQASCLSQGIEREDRRVERG